MNTSTASIYILAINKDFPVAGQRNDSQGFRTNFHNIKSALQTITATMQTISTQTVVQFQDNDIGGYNFINLTLENSRTTTALPGYGTAPIDHSQANYWPITLLESGNHSLSVINMPNNTGTGVLTVSISTTTVGTTVTFISDEATVISLGPEDQPFNLGSSTPYFFRIWNDYTGDIPYIYVKKISQDIIHPALSSLVSSDTILGDTASFNTLTLGRFTYTVDNLKAVVVSGINETSTATGNLGLVPRITRAVITGTVVGKAGGTAHSIGVADTTGIYPGDKVRFAGTTSFYTVANTVGTLVNLTSTFDVGYANVGDTITFIGNQFSQPTVMTMSDNKTTDLYGSLSTGSAYNLKGTVYADQNTLQVTYADPDGVNTNTVEFNISTTITNTTPTDLATIGIAHQWLPAGAIIMWSKSKTKIPYGWWLCDGTQTPNGITTPDLRNRFIYGADGELNGIPTVIDPTHYTQITSGGTSTAVLLPHTHLGTATTFAVHDPGHAHRHIGPNRTSPIGTTHPTDLDGLSTTEHQHHGTSNDNNFLGNTNDTTHWGFDTASTSTAEQWLTSPQYTFQDQQGQSSKNYYLGPVADATPQFPSTPISGSGIELETRITIHSTGTNSLHSNLPPYRSLYFIYKWLTA